MRDFNPVPKTLVGLLSKSYQGQISEQLLVSDIQIDSREVTPGSLFIAMRGIRDNGEKYIFNAVENGAVAIIVENNELACVLQQEIPVIGIENLRQEIATVAASFFDKPTKKLTVHGVTGTNGKSTITSFIAQLNQLMNKKSAIIGTLGYGLIDEPPTSTGMTTPDVVSCQRIMAELAEAKAKVVAMEVSSHGIDQGRVEGINYRVGVISNITRDHLDYHGSFKAYADVKRSFLLSDKCQTAVVNIDDAECAQLVDELAAKKKTCITYSIHNANADVHASVNTYTETGIEAQVSTPWGNATFSCPILGDFNLSNVLAALAASCAAGNSFEKVLEAVPFIRAVPGRLERIDVGMSKKLPQVYIDYAHTPDALEQVLKAIRKHTTGRLWIVFGCGGDRDKGKRAQMGAHASNNADVVIVTSDNPRGENPESIIADIMSGVDTNVVETIPQRELAIAMAIGSCHKNDLVLIAGKGHEDYQIIGDKKIAFSDANIARDALLIRRNSMRDAT